MKGKSKRVKQAIAGTVVTILAATGSLGATADDQLTAVLDNALISNIDCEGARITESGPPAQRLSETGFCQSMRGDFDAARQRLLAYPAGKAADPGSDCCTSPWSMEIAKLCKHMLALEHKAAAQFGCLFGVPEKQKHPVQHAIVDALNRKTLDSAAPVCAAVQNTREGREFFIAAFDPQFAHYTAADFENLMLKDGATRVPRGSHDFFFLLSQIQFDGPSNIPTWGPVPVVIHYGQTPQSREAGLCSGLNCQGKPDADEKAQIEDGICIDAGYGP
jgi:hypothetical protein